MAELPLPTALNLSAMSVSPSVKALQFSQDGQAILLTKYAVYILTPDTGVSVELSSVVQQASDSKSRTSHGTRPLRWLRTLVEFDRSLAHQWPTDCAEWGAVSLGSLDPSLHAVALSPSNITADAGCVLALLNSNLELTIWGASKNFLTGEWIRFQDVTAALKSATAKHVPSSAFNATLRLQSTCIEWSSQPDWNLTPAPLFDASVLAVGTRAGTVTFLRYQLQDRCMSVAEEVSVSAKWVTHIAWSAWTLSQDNTCEAMLSCGTSDGSVVVLTVRQSLNSNSSFAPDHNVSLTVQEHGEPPSDIDGRAITGMRWAKSCGRSPILIYHKPGGINLWSAHSTQNAWSGSRAFLLPTQRRSVGSSALSPASGICYVPSRDLAVVSLSDGSFYTIHTLSTIPALDPIQSEAIRSDVLSGVSRSVFVRAEAEKMSRKDVDRINGMGSYDGCATFMWTYEATRPTDFSYKHDAKHVSTLVVAQLWDEDIDERVLVDIAEHVGRTKCVGGEAPTSALRSTLLHLRDAKRLSRLHSRILETLHQLPHDGIAPDFVIPPYTGEWTAHLSNALRTSMTAHLFGWDTIQSQRIRYGISVFCQNRAETADVQQNFAEAASLFLANIRAHVQLVLLRHLSAMSGFVNGGSHDIFFARRTIHQAATMPWISPALAKEAEVLAARLPPTPQPQTDTPNASHYTNEGAAAAASGLGEPCPACNTVIPPESPDAESAVCANGHVWARCCVTSLLLATPLVRTCIGCSRKALLPVTPSAPVNPASAPPWSGDGYESGDHARAGRHALAPSAQLASAGGGALSANPAGGFSFVQDLLHATRRCPFCGNNFVVLV
ncbi:transcription factor IIIC subunit delta N-term-domain-containing protein [Daedaleopsis nitida]|nr:transcription factor IIIC subunit delta N-term-domain-containing protein [Daedaleopsis nitida]